MNNADQPAFSIKRFIPEKKNEDYAYKMGYDCGLNGSTLTNCAFGIFSSPENTKSWERGKKDAEQLKTTKPKP